MPQGRRVCERRHWDCIGIAPCAHVYLLKMVQSMFGGKDCSFTPRSGYRTVEAQCLELEGVCSALEFGVEPGSTGDLVSTPFGD